MTPNEKLDYILECIRNNEQIEPKELGIKEEDILNTLDSYYKYLAKKKLIIQGIAATRNSYNNGYVLTPKGEMFEGFVNQHDRKALEYEKQVADLKIAKRSNIVLAFATGILALEALFHIYDFFHKYNCH